MVNPTTQLLTKEHTQKERPKGETAVASGFAATIHPSSAHDNHFQLDNSEHL